MRNNPVDKYILHVDGDNFFVSCELQRFPHLKGTPVVVGEERGIASAMSPEAKKMGITRGMPIFQIRAKYKNVTVLPAHFELYEQYNQKMYDILCRYSNTVERYSIDECFAVIYDKNILSRIKKEAEEALGITLSFGLATTKTLAKIASKKEKPSGCVSFINTDVTEILKQTPIGSVWGIGRAISAELTGYNIHTAYDFTQAGRQFVEKNFGSNTLETWYELQGIEQKPVESSYGLPGGQKSFQSTRSFGYSTKERTFLLSELCTHTEILCKRLRMADLQTNHFSFFLKKNTDHNRYLSIELDIGFYTNNPSHIYGMILESFKEIYSSIYAYKGTGVSMHRVRPTETIQADLFGVQNTVQAQNAFLDVLDELQDDSVHLLASLESRRVRKEKEDIRNKRNRFIYGLPLPYMGEVS
ncbi:MAG: hypothetical protein FGM57_01220 [Candidatus Taylorbacteria bacterium]|nr:hypothetical protein [Candidatus Taylorbacteria bacterium]